MRRTSCILSGKTMCALLLGILVSGITASCSDDLDSRDYGKGGSIGFGISLSQNSNKAATRGGVPSGGEEAEISDIEVAPIKGATSPEGKQLYLHTVTYDGFTPEINAELAEREGKLKDITGQAPVTRAAPATSMYPDATVFATIYPADAASWKTDNQNYFNDLRISAAEGWKTTERWPNGSSWRLNFYAYAPHHCPGVIEDLPNGSYALRMSYTVPDEVEKQTDLLMALTTGRTQSQGTPPLKFYHALSAIRFETGDILPSTVTKIVLKGVNGIGDCTIGEGSWRNQTNVRTFTQNLNVTTPDPGIIGTAITPPSGTFMMIPQTLPTNAKIEVTITDKVSGLSGTLTADIGGTEWKMGHTYTYRINTSSIAEEPYLSVSPLDNKFYHNGGSDKITVKSYLTRKQGVSVIKVPVKWKTEFSTDNGATWHTGSPSWVTEFPKTGGGTTTDAEEKTVSVSAQQVNSLQLSEADKKLRNRPVKSLYNLSTKGGTAQMNTANCYMVDAPGAYFFPLVYGNAIKDGQDNKSAYTFNADLTYILKGFVNHRGVPITDPWIPKNANCVPSDAILVWQDAKDLVSNVKLSSDKMQLMFRVNQNTIQEGNAVVAVRDASGTIMWSWQIWVTIYDPSEDVEIKQHFPTTQSIFMSKYLGWCNSKTENFADRELKFRIVQDLPAYKYPLTRYGTIQQLPDNYIVGVNNVYYQYGRKDPIVGIGKRNLAKTWYDTNGKEHVAKYFTRKSFREGSGCVQDGILQPGIYCTNMNMDNQYYNLWNNGALIFAAYYSKTTKTIYDPCPPGYAVPHFNAFRQFTTTHKNTFNRSEFNVAADFNNGYNFYTGIGNNTLFLPATGDASWDGTYYGQLGCTWTSACDPTIGNELHFMAGHVWPMDLYNKGLGKPILPVRE